MSSQPFSIPHNHVRMGAAHALAVEDEAWWALRSEPLDESEINRMGLAGLIGVGATLGIVHVLTGADHMSALAQLSVGSRVKGFWLGVRWGLGHSAGLLIMYVCSAAKVLTQICMDALSVISRARIRSRL